MPNLRDYLFYEEPSITFYCGDALTVLRDMTNESVHCVVTSPPYWGLRDYGLPPIVWGDNWRGSLGLEPTPDLYVKHLVDIFREVRRVLRDDGTVWLNLGDSYARAPGRGVKFQAGDSTYLTNRQAEEGNRGPDIPLGLKEKDLIGIPWRVAFTLQADGWWLRSDIIWSKPNPMPESVTDRPTKSHEYLFLLAKSATYFYDAEAIKEPLKSSSILHLQQKSFDRQMGGPKDYANSGVNDNRSARRALVNLKGRMMPPQVGDSPEQWAALSGRNRRTVWEIPTAPFPDAHFATFPPDLVKPCILAGCPKDALALDPFCGSGTTVLVAKELGRRSLGIDLKSEYLEMAVKRLRQEVLPL